MTGRWMMAIVVSALAALAACDQPEMRDQAKVEAYETASDLPGGLAEQPRPEGVVARDERIAPAPPRPETTLALLRRGRTLYNDICAPCHSYTGDGRGMVVRRGFPPPPSFHTAALRRAGGDHFYRVVTEGRGLMYAYADRVAPEDRWAVVAYVRALQLSQHVQAASLPAALRMRLPEGEAVQ